MSECPINWVACSTPKPALLLAYVLITMASSIFHCFNITGWRKIWAFCLNYFLTMRAPKNSRLRRGIEKAPPSGENFHLWKYIRLLCHIPNFSLVFQNFYFSTVITVRRVELHHYAKFCRNRFNSGRNIAIFRYF